VCIAEGKVLRTKLFGILIVLVVILTSGLTGFNTASAQSDVVVVSQDGNWSVNVTTKTATWQGPTDGSVWVQTVGLFENPVDVAGSTYNSLLEMMRDGKITSINFSINNAGLVELCAMTGSSIDGNDMQAYVDSNRAILDGLGIPHEEYCVFGLPITVGAHVIGGNVGEVSGFTVSFDTIGWAVDASIIPLLRGYWQIDSATHTASWNGPTDGSLAIMPHPGLTERSRTWDSANSAFEVNSYVFTTSVRTFAYMCRGQIVGPTPVTATECNYYELQPGSYVYSFPSGRNRTATGMSVSKDEPASFIAVGAAAATSLTATVTVTGDVLNVRTGPGTSYSQVKTLNGGETVILSGRNSASDWFQIADGSGWVWGSRLDFGGKDTSVLPVVDVPIPG